jgi:hypothetical protein
MTLFPDQFPCARPSAVILLLVCVLFSVSIRAEEPQLQFTRISEFKNIVDIANAGDGSGRLFLVSQRGTIFILKDGKELETPFLSISSIVLDGGMILSRFKVSDDPDIADPASRETVLIVTQPFSNHNGGRLRFGPDRCWRITGSKKEDVSQWDRLV